MGVEGENIVNASHNYAESIEIGGLSLEQTNSLLLGLSQNKKPLFGLVNVVFRVPARMYSPLLRGLLPTRIVMDWVAHGDSGASFVGICTVFTELTENGLPMMKLFI